MRRRLVDDTGAVLPMVAMLLVVLLMAAAFAVDLGMQRVVARDMQALADVVALDMARLLDGSTTKGDLESSAAWTAALAATLARTDDHLGALDDRQVEAGRLDAATGDFVTIGDHEVPNAVRVTAEGSIGFAFAPAAGGPDRGGATRAAVALAGPSGCFRLGSFLLGADSGASPILDPLLGDLLNTTAVGYQGLAVATVELGDLAAELAVGTPEQLAAVDVTLADLYLATARALERRGDPTASAGVLQTIATQVPALPPISLGSLFALGDSGTVALATQVNVLDLVSGSAFIANGTNAVAVPDLGVTLPGVADLHAALTVIQQPIVACNDAVAETSQVTLVLSGDFTGELMLLECTLGLCVPSLPTLVGGPLTVTVDLATARGLLAGIDCTASPPAAMTVEVFDKTVASLEFDVLLSALGVDLARATARTESDPSSATSHPVPTTDADFGADGLTDPAIPTGTGDLGVEPTDLDVQLLSLSLLDDPDLVRALLAPTLAALNDALVDQIAPQLGLTIAGADLWGVHRPTCSHPALRG